MQRMGIFLIVAGLLLGLAGLMMDTTVAGGDTDALSGMLSRVYNAGLMARRALVLDMAQHLTLLGVLLYGLAAVVEAVQSMERTNERRTLEVVDALRKGAPSGRPETPKASEITPQQEAERFGITYESQRYTWQGNHFKTLNGALEYARANQPRA